MTHAEQVASVGWNDDNRSRIVAKDESAEGTYLFSDGSAVAFGGHGVPFVMTSDQVVRLLNSVDSNIWVEFGGNV